jgi:hypothetical protein
MNGYMGKILVVDLTKKELKDEALNEQYARDFLGAGGIACRYLADMIDEKTDPLGPDNPLIFMTGLLTGTGGPSLSRWVVAARSPYTTFSPTPTGQPTSVPSCASPVTMELSSKVNPTSQFISTSKTASRSSRMLQVFGAKTRMKPWRLSAKNMMTSGPAWPASGRPVKMKCYLPTS